MHCCHKLIFQKVTLVICDISCRQRQPVFSAFQNAAPHCSAYSIFKFFSNLIINTLVSHQRLQFGNNISAITHLGATKHLTNITNQMFPAYIELCAAAR